MAVQRKKGKLSHKQPKGPPWGEGAFYESVYDLFRGRCASPERGGGCPELVRSAHSASRSSGWTWPLRGRSSAATLDAIIDNP
jgi:hypothetical protein